VKQSDLGEYEENTREKQNIQYTSQKHQLPFKPSHMDDKHQISQTQEGSNQITRFLNAKEHTPPKTKANQIKHQTQQKTPTPPEVENLRFYQMSLDKPQGKHRPLKQQSKSKCIQPRHKSHKSKNNHQRS
jgi:hypothetical protein